jgi:catechol 2,3-dioxygenase-like lactoylglutathione lyase family enzyme
MSLADADLVAFVPSTDLPRARAFYVEALGLRLQSETEHALVFDAHGTTLRVTRVPRLDPAAHTVLGWTVPDIAAAAAALVRRGVALTRYEGMGQDLDGIWRAPGGARVAWFSDPDGNTLSMTQLP